MTVQYRNFVWRGQRVLSHGKRLATLAFCRTPTHDLILSTASERMYVDEVGEVADRKAPVMARYMAVQVTRCGVHVSACSVDRHENLQYRFCSSSPSAIA